MLDLDTATRDIESWIKNFVEDPHPALGGWPPCPYARHARLNQEYEIRLGHSLIHDLVQISHQGLGNKQVVIMIYAAQQHTANEFEYLCQYCNQLYLHGQDLICLTDHPADPETVNGVTFNQGTYALALVQGLADLDQKARAMAQKGFYDAWPEDYLRKLFFGRQDPRS